MDVDVPPAEDTDGNGLPDFFEPAKGVEPAETVGYFWGEFADGEGIVAEAVLTWKRDAGSNSGDVDILLTLEGDFPLELEFATRFELLQYKGTLHFRRDSAAVTSGTLDLTLDGAAGIGLPNSFSGEIDFTVASSEDVTLSGGRLSASDGSELRHEGLAAVRLGEHYITAILPNLNSPLPAYGAWIMDIRDTNDTDGDGIPDFSDEPVAGSPPDNGGGPPVGEPGLEAWRRAWFGANAGNAALAGNFADADGDLLPTILEYAVMHNPLRADGNVFEVEISVDTIVLTFTRNPRANDIDYRIEASESLTSTNWDVAASCSGGGEWIVASAGIDVETISGAEFDHVRVLIDRDPVVFRGNQFYRLAVRLSEEDPPVDNPPVDDPPGQDGVITGMTELITFDVSGFRDSRTETGLANWKLEVILTADENYRVSLHQSPTLGYGRIWRGSRDQPG